jgi:hypothetical protein
VDLDYICHLLTGETLNLTATLHRTMKICVYANVDVDWREQIQTPYGISQFRSYITRNFITSDQPYKHPSARAVEGDVIVWAFKDVDGKWHLLGDGFVVSKYKEKRGDYWNFSMDGARLYPRSVILGELSFGSKIKRALNIGYDLNSKEYGEIIEKAGSPLVQ